MPGTTPVYGLTYPIGSDRLDAAVTTIPQQLAEDVESTIAGFGGIAAPGSWQTPSYGSGFASLGFGNTDPEYRKVGTCVWLRGVATTSTTQGANATVLTLPSGYRPLAQEVFLQMNNTGPAQVNVEANGEVSVVAGLASSGWVSLSGISFYID